ncbi:hypothetical protein GTW69_17920 [Streptomyces sp. SID7760]|nr:hypothetical protein [Streptomyces sp. SID7760]
MRIGQDVATAAQAAGMGVRQVFTAARTGTALALPLAGTDPEEPSATGIIKRAEYLRLLALGCTPSLAAQILLDGTGKASHWRRRARRSRGPATPPGIVSGQTRPGTGARRHPRTTPDLHRPPGNRPVGHCGRGRGRITRP